MIESREKEELRDKLVSWRSWSEEKVNSQNKWVLRIIFGRYTRSRFSLYLLFNLHKRMSLQSLTRS